MLDADGNARTDIFLKDMLHLNHPRLKVRGMRGE